jgi:hypothetical protein
VPNALLPINDLDIPDLLRLSLSELRSGFSSGDHLGLVRMRIAVLLGVPADLSVELGLATGGGDQSEEGRRGVQWSGAEFGMGLKTDEVGVVYDRENAGFSFVSK